MLKRSRPLRIAVLCSSRAPGLEPLLSHPRRDDLYEIACVITSEPYFAGRAPVENSGVSVLVHPIRQFHQECGASLRNEEVRRSYDALTVHILQQLDVDAVLLLGYLYVVSDVLLAAFPDRVFNIHDSDLTLTASNGERKYVGLHSTLDTILGGDPDTRSTLHLVTPKLDGGPVLMQSAPYPVAPFAREAAREGHLDIVKAYAYAQREWMMRHCWGDLAIAAIEMVASEDVEAAFAEARSAGPQLLAPLPGLQLVGST
jgi:phosphoribosylglycinamide formyltransferase 1